VGVDLNPDMFSPENPSEQKQPKPKRHNGKFCSFSNRQRIVNALAAGDAKTQIARALRVSSNTVSAIAEQEWRNVENRKARIAAQCERAATKAFELINHKLDSDGDIPLNQLTITGGVCVDKLLALRGDPNLNVHIEHDFPQINIFQAFQRFHDEQRALIHAREVQQQDSPPALPVPPPAPTDLPQANP
jgi:hypothetical protein